MLFLQMTKPCTAARPEQTHGHCRASKDEKPFRASRGSTLIRTAPPGAMRASFAHLRGASGRLILDRDIRVRDFSGLRSGVVVQRRTAYSSPSQRFRKYREKAPFLSRVEVHRLPWQASAWL